MQRVTLASTDLSVSRFIFGTAGLFNAGWQRTRRRLLDAAFDHGITHFDTAPYYGFGTAECDLKPLLARHAEASVTTKVGLYSPGGEQQPYAAVFLRKAGGRLLPALSAPSRDWSAKRARKALGDSLRRLGRDRIDLYMLHEPDLTCLSTDEWCRWLEDEVAAGRVGRFGLAAEAKRLLPFLDARNGLDHAAVGRSLPTADNVIDFNNAERAFSEKPAPPFSQHALSDLTQTLDSLDGREADALLARGRPLQITYGYVSGALRRNRQADIANVLAAALQRNRSGAVIVSTRHAARMRLYAEVAAAS